MAWMGEDGSTQFKRELERSQPYVVRVVERLKAAGFQAEQTPMVVRDKVEDRHAFANEQDIIVTIGVWKAAIEVKSRGVPFSDNPDSFPYPTAFVDTVSGWDRKNPAPFAVVAVAQSRGGMLVVSPKESREHWTKVMSRDHKRGIDDEFYVCPRKLLFSFSALVSGLKRQGVVAAKDPIEAKTDER